MLPAGLVRWRDRWVLERNFPSLETTYSNPDRGCWGNCGAGPGNCCGKYRDLPSHSLVLLHVGIHALMRFKGSVLTGLRKVRKELELWERGSWGRLGWCPSLRFHRLSSGPIQTEHGSANNTHAVHTHSDFVQDYVSFNEDGE